MRNEDRFYSALEKIFVGASIEGEGGFVNLLAIKSKYYEGVLEIFKQEVSTESILQDPKVKEEFFDRLYSFFEKYFSECGSVYFAKTANWQNVYEKIYTDSKDVVLFWKTNMLYYVKSDILFHNIDVTVPANDGTEYKFFFDCGALQNKQNNEKKELIFTPRCVEEDKRIFDVSYSTHGKKNRTEENAKYFNIGVEIMQKAEAVFKKQNTVDFFINKDARRFLTEQLDLYLHQMLLEEKNVFDTDRLSQLKTVKEFALKIIDFIAQFENELVRIWDKPKFVYNSNYVITLDRLPEVIVTKLKAHSGWGSQKAEWAELNIDEKGEYAPIDTKHFKDLEGEILALFTDLDEALDGRLIRSENYQALITLTNRYKEKVQCIYIDPPFNTGTDFIFLDAFQDSTWLNIIYDRLYASYPWLRNDGSIYLHLDHISEHYGRELLDSIYGKEQFKAKITWNTGDNISGFKAQAKNWIRQADYIHFYTKDVGSYFFTKVHEKLPNVEIQGIGWLDVLGNEKDDHYIEVWDEGKLIQKPILQKTKPKGTVWNDIYSFMLSEPRETESLSFVSNQKPENLLRRIIQSSTNPGQLVADFFAGSGTTPAVAHKLGRKYLAVEMGDYFCETYLVQEDVKNEQLSNAVIVEVIAEKEKSKTIKIRKIGLLGRMKIVINGDKKFLPTHSKFFREPHLSKDINWQGGGFFKYYELEQYEDTLRKMKYSQNASTIFDRREPFSNYVFRADSKLADILEIDAKSGEIKSLDFDLLYPNIDFAETFSLIKGKAIKTITPTSVVLVNDEGSTEEICTDYKNMSTKDKVEFVKMLKPLLWWGE